MSVLEEDGFQIGPIYIVKYRNTTELIPRESISYVSARYESNLVLLVAGLAALIGAGGYYNMHPTETNIVALLAVVGAVLLLAYVLSRRVGIVIASAGGKLFVETRGRNRLALLSRIYADLHQHLATGPRAAVTQQ